MPPTLYLDPKVVEHNLKIFVVKFNKRTSKDCTTTPIQIPREVLIIIAEFARPTLRLTRAWHVGGYARDDYTPDVKWLSKFMTIERNWVMAGFSNPKKRREFKKEALERFQATLHDLNWVAWDHVTRFYVTKLGRNAKHQFLLYEPYTNNKKQMDDRLRRSFGHDNFKKYIHTRVVPGGMQIFLFGPEIDQKSVLDCSLFRQHSYFSLRRRRNSQGYWYYINYDLHSMPSSHKPLYDFALNRHQKSTRRAVSISMQ